MKENENRYNRIRYLVARWYEGSTTFSEEDDLKRLLKESDHLPADLEGDKLLICGLDDLAIAEINIPEEYSSRINSALEKEMARSGFFRVRRFLWAAASVAVLALGGLLILRTSEKSGVKTGEGFISELTIGLPSLEEDTLLKGHSLELNSGQSGHVAYIPSSGVKSSGYGTLKTLGYETPEKSIRQKERKTSVASNYSDGSYEPDDEDSSTQELEERLLSSNYRVIRNEEEAADIINSVFGQLEANIEMEKSKVNKITLDYDSQMINLFDVENVNIYKTQYHEQAPI